MNRAYSLLAIKDINEDQRIIAGIATTPTPDLLDDVVEPAGAEFDLPIPLLWQHNSREPIGEVSEAKVTDGGIEVVATIARSMEPGRLKERLDEAWQSLTMGLVKGLSIGFKSLESARIEDAPGYALRFIRWRWLELSAVTIPANSEATITAIKSFDIGVRQQRLREALPLPPAPAASGKKGHVVRLKDPARDRAEPFVIRNIKRMR